MANLEIACFNVQSALIAQEYGADRVELCAGMEVGGTTPKTEDIVAAREALHIKLHVMIRPRGGNFIYSPEEYELMKNDIIRIKELGVDGFVFGVLTIDNRIDIELNRELVQLSKPFPCTFHRAFDEVSDYKTALEDAVKCEFSTILTSGGQSNVDVGMSTLKELVKLSNGRITIMPGGGLRSTNVKTIMKGTNAVFFHSSAITDRGNTANGEEVKKIKTFIH